MKGQVVWPDSQATADSRPLLHFPSQPWPGLETEVDQMASTQSGVLEDEPRTGLSLCDCKEPAKVREVRAGFPGGKQEIFLPIHQKNTDHRHR